MQAVVIHAPKDLRISEMTLPVSAIVIKELQLRGTLRFDPEFELAPRLMGEGRIDVKLLISAALPPVLPPRLKSPRSRFSTHSSSEASCSGK